MSFFEILASHATAGLVLSLKLGKLLPHGIYD